MRFGREHNYFPLLVTIRRLALCCIFFPENSRGVMICSEADFVNSCQSTLHRETVLSKGDFSSFIESYCPSIYQGVKFGDLSSTLQKDFNYAVCYNDIYNNGTDCMKSNDQLFPTLATISKPSTTTSEYNETITFLCRNVYNDLDPTCHHISSFTTTASHSKSPSVTAETAATATVSPMASPTAAPSLPSKPYATIRPTKTTASIRATPRANQTNARTSPTSSSVISSRDQPQEYNNIIVSSSSKVGKRNRSCHIFFIKNFIVAAYPSH
jgi:hypothetical protein